MAIKVSGGNKVNAELEELRAKLTPFRVVAGLPANAAAYPDGTSVVDVGTVQEFGSPSRNIPERSFLRSTLQANKAQYRKLLLGACKLMAKGENYKTLAGQIGQKLENDIKAKIVSGPFTPNAPLTILLKGSSKPLIDTGHMRQSIRWELREVKK